MKICCDKFRNLYGLIVTSGKHLYDLGENCIRVYNIPRDCLYDSALGEYGLLKCPFCGKKVTYPQ